MLKLSRNYNKIKRRRQIIIRRKREPKICRLRKYRGRKRKRPSK
jgi:hypothetical protein